MSPKLHLACPVDSPLQLPAAAAAAAFAAVGRNDSQDTVSFVADTALEAVCTCSIVCFQ
jgi:hypothetical protein